MHAKECCAQLARLRCMRFSRIASAAIKVVSQHDDCSCDLIKIRSRNIMVAIVTSSW